MGKNNKPILSVLVDADKKEQFADLARAHKQSMGWLLNDCIDRMLAANSIDIYSNSVGAMDNISKLDRMEISALDIEEIIKTYTSNHLDITSIGMPREDIESIVKSYVDTDKLNDDVNTRINEALDKQIRPLIERSVAEELLKVSSDVTVLEELVKAQIEPIADKLKEHKDLTAGNFVSVRSQLLELKGEIDALVELKKPMAIAKLKAPGVDIEQLVQAQTELEPPTSNAPESNGEPTELTYREFCKHYGIEVPDDTPNQPPSSVVKDAIAQVKAQGHFGWCWKSALKRLVREV
jgi:hypothetical protein